MSTTTDELDLAAGQYVRGIKLSDTVFMVVTDFKQLKVMTRDPRYLQPNAKVTGSDADELEAEAAVHELIQRALTGNKKSNVAPYAAYIEQLVMGERVGVLPPMHLWTQDALNIVTHGSTSYALVPNGEHLLAIDGETQLTAHWTLTSSSAPMDTKKAHREFKLGAIIHHGVPVNTARQYFHDLNVLAVRPNTSLGLSMDTTDPIMQVVGDLELAIPVLVGRVDKQARQLPKKSNKIVTLQALRQMTVNVAKNIAGVQYGSRPVPSDDLDLVDVQAVAETWIGAFFKEFEREIADRENYLAGTAPVLAAVGAMGNLILRTPPEDRPRQQERLLELLREVHWEKDRQWNGIAGGYTASGAFSVKGTKEVAYAVFNALTDRDNGGYTRVRQGPKDISPDLIWPGQGELVVDSQSHLEV